jgi:arylsulfatase A-like enzyme
VTRNGPESEVSRLSRERAEFTGFDGQGLKYPPDWFPPLPLMRGDRVVETNPDQSTLTGRYHAEALQFIERSKDKPFFLYLAHAMPHVPLYPGKEFAGKSIRGRYGDVIEEIDSGVGRILAKLKQLRLDNDTLVIYTSDNGPWAPYGIDAGSAGPLKGAKGSVWEGGIRVPAIFRFPGAIRPGQIHSEVAATIDLLPTIAALAGVKPPAALDGKNIAPLLNGAKSPHERFYYFDTAILYKPEEGRPTSNSNLLAVREGQWKLHLKTRELYDLHGDIGETRNVAARHPELVARLTSEAEAFVTSLRREIRPLGSL